MMQDKLKLEKQLIDTQQENQELKKICKTSLDYLIEIMNMPLDNIPKDKLKFMLKLLCWEGKKNEK